MDFIFGTLFGIVISYFAVRVMIRLIVDKVEREMGQTLDSLLKDNKHSTSDDATQIKARVENINGVFYIFDVRNGNFIAQGKSMGEILEHIKARTINHDIVVSEGDPEVMSKFRSTQV